MNKEIEIGIGSRLKIKSMLLIVFVLVLGFISHGQTTLTLSASSDAFIDQASATTNFGTTNYLQTYPWTSSYSKRSLIKFDLSSIPSGATIISADLYLYNYGTSGYARTLAVHRVTSSWTETGVTWNSFNGAFHGTATSTCSVTWPGSVNGQWDVKSDVQSVVNGSNSNYGWLLKDNSEDGKQVIMHSDSLKIKSNEMSIKEIVDSIDCKQCTLKDLLSNRTLANYKEVHWIDERPLVLSYICLKYSDSNYVHIFFDELKYNKRTTTTYSWKLSDFYPEIVSDFKYSKSFYRR